MKIHIEDFECSSKITKSLVILDFGLLYTRSIKMFINKNLSFKLLGIAK